MNINALAFPNPENPYIELYRTFPRIPKPITYWEAARRLFVWESDCAANQSPWRLSDPSRSKRYARFRVSVGPLENWFLTVEVGHNRTLGKTRVVVRVTLLKPRTRL